MHAPSDSPLATLPPGEPPIGGLSPFGGPAEKVSGASRRLRALAALSGSLTDPLDPADAATLVEQKALSALGATSAVVVTLGAFPIAITRPGAQETGAYAPATPVLVVLHAIGLPAEVRATLEELPLDSPVPLAEVAREGEPLFLASEPELHRYGEWGAALIAAGARAAAIVPVWANGELRGVLGLTWPEPRIFDEDERAFVLTLGVMCAQAIMRAHLRAAERKAREEAERANQSKARFVATISHELRTPMNAVLGYTELLTDEIYGPVNDLQRDHLGRVRASGTHLMSLIEDLLGYARLDAGEDVMRAEAVLLADVVEQSLTLVRPIAAKKGLQIRVEGLSTPLTLHTDPRKLRQILVNLLANAVKFTGTGDVLLLLRIEGRDADARVCMEVTDSGRGISVEDQGHIFEPFWQAEPNGVHADGSTGLGLSVARQLARLLGGDVTMTKSALGVGSTFQLCLPAALPARGDGST